MRHPTAKLDRIAVQLSALCLLHCLALPVLIAAVPMLGLADSWHEGFHQIMLWLVVPLAVAALGRGYHRHRRLDVVALGIAGTVLLGLAALVLHDHAELGHGVTGARAERWVTVAGALVLGAAHFVNARATRCTHRPADGSCIGP